MSPASMAAVPFLRKVGQHLRWIRTEGVARLVEEDQLDPRQRVRSRLARRKWRREHGIEPGSATPIFIVGVQRSGTNMLARGLESDPAIEVHNENDRAAFSHYRLREVSTIGAIVNASRHQYVLFKPLCDSGRITAVVDALPVSAESRVVWAWRDVDARARSAVAKFGDANLRALAQIAQGEGDHLWQAVGLSPASRQLLMEFDYDELSSYEAACLFWLVRNSMVFEQGLFLRSDVLVSSYDVMVADPESSTRALSGFLGIPWDPRLVADIDSRAAARPAQQPIDDRIRARCEDLAQRLADVSSAGVDRYADSPDQ